MIPAIMDAADELGFGPEMRAAHDALDRIALADNLIAEAQARYPESADALHHSFPLLQVTSNRLKAPIVYAAHCRELLERLAIGADTRPGTAVEICLAMMEVSMTAPLNAAGFALYSRAWLSAGLPDVANLAASAEHREYLHGHAVDDAEAYVRKKLARPDRQLVDVTCSGRHHREPIRCRYAKPVGSVLPA